MNRKLLHIIIAFLLVILTSAANWRKKGPINPKDIEVYRYELQLPNTGTTPTNALLGLGSGILLLNQNEGTENKKREILISSQTALFKAVLNDSSPMLSSPNLIQPIEEKVVPYGAVSNFNKEQLLVCSSDSPVVFKLNEKNEIIETIAPGKGLPLELQKVRNFSGAFQAANGLLLLLGSSIDSATNTAMYELFECDKTAASCDRYQYPVNKTRYQAQAPVLIAGLSQVSETSYLTVESSTALDGNIIDTLTLLTKQENSKELISTALISLQDLDWGKSKFGAMSASADGKYVALVSKMDAPQSTTPQVPLELWVITIPGEFTNDTFLAWVSVIATVALGALMMYFAFASARNSKQAVS